MRENVGIQQLITIVIKYLLIIRVQRLPKNTQLSQARYLVIEFQMPV